MSRSEPIDVEVARAADALADLLLQRARSGTGVAALNHISDAQIARRIAQSARERADLLREPRR